MKWRVPLLACASGLVFSGEEFEGGVEYEAPLDPSKLDLLIMP